MSRRRGGAGRFGEIPHAWLLTQHEMFMLSVCGSAHLWKTGPAIRVRPRPPFHVFLHQCGGVGGQ